MDNISNVINFEHNENRTILDNHKVNDNDILNGSAASKLSATKSPAFLHKIPLTEKQVLTSLNNKKPNISVTDARNPTGVISNNSGENISLLSSEAGITKAGNICSSSLEYETPKSLETSDHVACKSLLKNSVCQNEFNYDSDTKSAIISSNKIPVRNLNFLLDALSDEVCSGNQKNLSINVAHCNQTSLTKVENVDSTSTCTEEIKFQSNVSRQDNCALITAAVQENNASVGNSEICSTETVNKHLVDVAAQESLGNILISLNSPSIDSQIPVETPPPPKIFTEEEVQGKLKIHELETQDTYIKKQREMEMEITKRDELLKFQRLVTEELSNDFKKGQEKIMSLEAENVKLKDDLEASAEDLQSVENTFTDFYKWYEQSKSMLKTYKDNEEHLMQTISDLQTKAKEQEQMYHMLQERTEEMLEKAKLEVDNVKRSGEAQVTVLKAQLKKAEMKISSLRVQSDIKKENSQLGGICDYISFFDNPDTTIHRKPSPVAMDTASSASCSGSPLSRAVNKSPVSFMSATSTASPSTHSDSTQDSSNKLMHHKVVQQSPPPPRKILSKEKEKELRESKVDSYSPAAFKFFMEQHVENLLKSHQEREYRRQQLESEMAEAGLDEEDRCEIRKMLHQKESNYIRLKRAKMDKSMFHKIRTIGIGTFGEVALVRKVDAAQLYVMKTLRKSDVLKKNQVAHVKAQRDILAEADNEWIVKLYYSFQDDENLYFVMDFIEGGDLLTLLISKFVLSEELARFYIAELVLAVESVHEMGFIHRDIKPDNILIDRDGHIKLTDFGLCTGFRWTHNSKYYQRNGENGGQDSMDSGKWSNECHCRPYAYLKPLEMRRRREHQHCLAHSLVGTPNYMAPEVLRKTGYALLCDWWSVGVILFEMLIGYPPFHAATPTETQFNVFNWKTSLRIPDDGKITDSAADLILQLCREAESRLGRNGVDEIKQHPFFAPIDFNSDLRKTRAPHIPEIKYSTDTSNFDSIDSGKLSSDYGDLNDRAGDNIMHPEHAFLEFSFRRFFDDDGQVYPSCTPSFDEAPDKQSSPVYI